MAGRVELRGVYVFRRNSDGEDYTQSFPQTSERKSYTKKQILTRFNPHNPVLVGTVHPGQQSITLTNNLTTRNESYTLPNGEVSTETWDWIKDLAAQVAAPNGRNCTVFLTIAQ